MIALDKHASGRHFLQIPGPSPVPDRILRAISLPTIDHRGPEFGALGLKVIAGLQQVFQTRHPVVIYPASGTGEEQRARLDLPAVAGETTDHTFGASGDVGVSTQQLAQTTFAVHPASGAHWTDSSKPRSLLTAMVTRLTSPSRSSGAAPVRRKPAAMMRENTGAATWPP